MTELGNTLYTGSYEQFISSADGMTFPTGTNGQYTFLFMEGALGVALGIGRTSYAGKYEAFISSADSIILPDGKSGQYTFLFMDGYTGTALGLGKTYSINRFDLFTLPTPSAHTLTTYFVMRGRDVDCGSVTYRTWTVAGSPDVSGAQYSGPKCGGSSLTDIVVIDKYSILT